MENSSRIVIDLRDDQATGCAEREHGLAMLGELGAACQITVAGDRDYDSAGFAAGCRALNVTPHVAQNARRPAG